MTPDQIGSFVERYGLPLLILMGLLWLLLSRRLVLGSEANYIEARRVEEREGRLASEATNKVLTEAVESLSDGMESLQPLITAAIERALAEDRGGQRREGR